MPYKHTQIGHLMIFILCALAIYFWFILEQIGKDPILITILILVLFLIASFSTLTVSINESHLRIKFGYGIAKKSFDLRKITSAKKVKNHWYYGWGIRVWFWPYMWIFNISGFDAVEIKMKNGKIYRIGTDEPDDLERAINQAIK